MGYVPVGADSNISFHYIDRQIHPAEGGQSAPDKQCEQGGGTYKMGGCQLQPFAALDIFFRPERSLPFSKPECSQNLFHTLTNPLPMPVHFSQKTDYSLYPDNIFRPPAIIYQVKRPSASSSVLYRFALTGKSSLYSDQC